MKNTLKLLAYLWDGSYYGIDIDDKDVPESEVNSGSFWYLHGKLEKIIGYDKAIAINSHAAGYTKNTIDWSTISGNIVTSVHSDNERPTIYINDIVPVYVVGVSTPCIGYFWTTNEQTIQWKDKKYPHWVQRGLVCLANDQEAIDHIEPIYKLKSDII